MILPRLVDAGGGSSRLGGLVQRGLGLLRKAFIKKTPTEPDQGLLVQQLRCQPIVPPEPVLAAVRRGAREVLSTYLARNQIQTVAAEMRRRYAFRLMSGPVGLNPGLRNRIAIYGFVGLSFGNALYNRDNQQPLEDSHTVQGFKELFSPKHNEELISEKVEEDTFSVVEYNSMSADSDVVILSDESDFEILESSGVLVMTEENDCIAKSDSIVCDEVLEQQELIELENKQPAELCSLIWKLFQENKVLKDIVNTQEKLLKTELTNILTSSTEQQNELLMLRGLVAHQKAALKTLYNRHRRNKATAHQNKGQPGGQNPKSNGIPTRDMVCEKECKGSVGCDSLENEREKLIATGGQTRALKIHRKQRFKRN